MMCAVRPFRPVRILCVSRAGRKVLFRSYPKLISPASSRTARLRAIPHGRAGVRSEIQRLARPHRRLEGNLRPGGCPHRRGMKNTTSTTQQADRWSGRRPLRQTSSRARKSDSNPPSATAVEQLTPRLTPLGATRASAAGVFEYTFSRRRIGESVGTVNDPRDVAAILRLYLDPESAEQERLAVALLNVKHEVIGVETIYIGNTSGASVRVGEVFRGAVRVNASAVVVAHNHPSGDPTPSGDDFQVTAALAAAGHLLDIPLLDHVIVGSATQWTSLRAIGRLEA